MTKCIPLLFEGDRMKLLLIGDVHGEWKSANKLIRSAIKEHPDVTHVVQVGDLGDHWPKRGGGFSRWNVEEATSLPVHWLDGNHDNHDELGENGKTPNPYLIYQPRGSILEIDGYRMLFMGGASSIDKNYRLSLMNQGHPKIWWEQESISMEDYNRAISQEGPFDAIFSHERADSFDMGLEPLVPDVGRSDRIALEGLLDHFKPKFWFFGHHHHTANGFNERTQTEWTLCPVVGPADPPHYVVWDGEKVQRTWEK